MVGGILESARKKKNPEIPGGSISTHTTLPVRKRADRLKAGDYVKGPNGTAAEILSIEEGVNQDNRKCLILRLYREGVMVVKEYRFVDSYPVRDR